MQRSLVMPVTGTKFRTQSQHRFILARQGDLPGAKPYIVRRSNDPAKLRKEADSRGGVVFDTLDGAVFYASASYRRRLNQPRMIDVTGLDHAQTPCWNRTGRRVYDYGPKPRVYVVCCDCGAEMPPGHSADNVGYLPLHAMPESN